MKTGIETIRNYSNKDAECPWDPSLPDAHNTFYAHRLTVPQGEHLLCVFSLRGMLQRFNPPKVASPDNVLGTVLRDYAHELINWVQTDIFNTSFSEAVVLVCLKISVIIPKRQQ